MISFQTYHWSSLPHSLPPLETRKLENWVTQKLRNSETRKLGIGANIRIGQEFSVFRLKVMPGSDVRK